MSLSAMYAIAALTGLAFCYAMWEFFVPYMTKRRVACLFGRHHADTVRAEVGGRNVQRCLYCDKVMREYTVSKEGANKNPVIRRIY